MLGSREIFEERFKPVLEEARRDEERCLQGKRWGGNALLILVDAALDSIGLSYFKTVVPRVRRFYLEYLKPGIITSFQDFSSLKPLGFGLRMPITINGSRTRLEGCLGLAWLPFSTCGCRLVSIPACLIKGSWSIYLKKLAIPRLSSAGQSG